MATAAALSSPPLLACPRRFSPPITTKRLVSSSPLRPPNPSYRLRRRPRSTRRIRALAAQDGVDSAGHDEFVLEDVPHLTNHLPELQGYTTPIRKSQAYAIVKQNFVTSEDVVAQTVGYIISRLLYRRTVKEVCTFDALDRERRFTFSRKKFALAL